MSILTSYIEVLIVVKSLRSDCCSTTKSRNPANRLVQHANKSHSGHTE